MKKQSFARRLLGTTSLVVLSAVATVGAQPASAQTTISTGIYGGGTTLSSLASPEGIAGLPEELISALETRAIWAKFGF